MKLEYIFTPEELASIDSGTYDITRLILAAKLDLWAALEREACIKALEENEQFYCRDTIRARGEKL